jgi:hypothetical protein
MMTIARVIMTTKVSGLEGCMGRGLLKRLIVDCGNAGFCKGSGGCCCYWTEAVTGRRGFRCGVNRVGSRIL